MRYWATHYFQKTAANLTGFGTALNTVTTGLPSAVAGELGRGSAEDAFVEQNPESKLPNPGFTDMVYRLGAGLFPLWTAGIGAVAGHHLNHSNDFLPLRHDVLYEPDTMIGGMTGLVAGLPIQYMMAKKLEQSRLNNSLEK